MSSQMTMKFELMLLVWTNPMSRLCCSLTRHIIDADLPISGNGCTTALIARSILHELSTTQSFEGPSDCTYSALWVLVM